MTNIDTSGYGWWFIYPAQNQAEAMHNLNMIYFYGTLTVSFILLMIYMLPTLVARSRSHPCTASIFVINFFLGWSVVAWVLCLAWAVSNNRYPPMRGLVRRL
jgi:hypothetical protein